MRNRSLNLAKFFIMTVTFLIPQLSPSCLIDPDSLVTFNSFTSVCPLKAALRALFFLLRNLSLVMRKPAFCICENKDADQLCGNREADQRLCFSYTDSTIPLLYESDISSLYSYSAIAQPGLC